MGPSALAAGTEPGAASLRKWSLGLCGFPCKELRVIGFKTRNHRDQKIPHGPPFGAGKERQRVQRSRPPTPAPSTRQTRTEIPRRYSDHALCNPSIKCLQRRRGFHICRDVQELSAPGARKSRSCVPFEGGEAEPPSSERPRGWALSSTQSPRSLPPPSQLRSCAPAGVRRVPSDRNHVSPEF